MKKSIKFKAVNKFYTKIIRIGVDLLKQYTMEKLIRNSSYFNNFNKYIAVVLG